MKVEFRNNSVILDGYVNVPQRDSRELPSPRGKFVEQISQRAFEKALGRTDNVDLLFNHKEDRKLGSTMEGNLEVYEDAVGLRAICTVTDEEVIQKAKNNELRGWSFGFICREDRWVDGDVQRRYVDELDLLEVSILDMTPAYYSTTIESRGHDLVERRVEVDSDVNEHLPSSMVENDQVTEQVISATVTTEITTEISKMVGDDLVVETTKEETLESFDYSRYRATVEILKIKGGTY
jgi:hypothetical protein